MSTTTETVAAPPAARLIFTQGSYDHALICYHIAKEWLLNEGLCFSSGLAGIINSPTFRGETPPAVMADRWIDNIEMDGWRVTVDFYFADNAPLELRAYLRGKVPPPHAELVWPDDPTH